MALKKALFLGGAVLLLAACSDATAPKPQLRSGGQPAAAAKAVSGSGPSTASDPGTGGGILDDCRSGYYIRVGDQDVCVDWLMDQP